MKKTKNDSLQTNENEDFNNNIQNTLENNDSDSNVGRNRFKIKEVQHTLKVRTLSAVVLLILLFSYVASGAIYTDGIVQNLKTPLLEIAAYVSIVMSMFLVSISTYELNHSFDFRKPWIQVLSIVIANIWFLFPTSLAMSSYHPYNYLELDKWFQWWMPVILAIVILAIYLLIAWYVNKQKIIDGFFLVVLVFVIVFAYKGFSNTELELVIPNNSSSPYDARHWKYGFNTILWAWLIIIFTDTFAYFGGMTFGKHKMAPVVSPKKTWEGTIIGVTTSTIAGSLFAILLLVFPLPNDALSHTPWSVPIKAFRSNSGVVATCLIYVVFSQIFAVVGVLGDLLFSLIKRYKKLKDYSNLIPGHGGVLDRMDSFTLVFFAMFFIELVIK
ncbi:phosphatidate cytidylyltransferase [Spiroplasma endosymbiont of Labia minor]|uniref:phosphatidate cytidylyltransferase n=1 Tax=Spiroplasma endosymbiont of Labia minor TaxID=3066305 RepID=UPI0030CDAF61